MALALPDLPFHVAQQEVSLGTSPLCTTWKFTSSDSEVGGTQASRRSGGGQDLQTNIVPFSLLN